MTDTPPPPPDTPPPLIMGRSGLVELNIGGKPYTTTRQTLENSGFLRALTSGSFAAPRDAQGRIFVDRDATQAFDTMLTFLRGALGRTALDRMDLTTRAELVAEAEFYDVPALIEGAVLPPVGALVRYSPVWKSTSASGAHRHAIEQASRRWRGGRRDGSARNFHTQVHRERARAAGPVALRGGRGAPSYGRPGKVCGS